MDMAKQCRLETETLHDFLRDWLVGALPRTDDAFARFRDVMAPGLMVISPLGTRTELNDLLTEFESIHGVLAARKDSFRIEVKNYECHRLIGEQALVTYEEWHMDGDDVSARLSTVLYGPKRGTPHGVEWQHVHETWLPGLAPAAGERFPEPR
ncbi:hypothetical protein [Minwuia sp.]|uniref:hypothetical protein n=1 Tax=Minwuia sp. TaxID=2493630 RepID=UPI003A8F09FA